MIVFSRVKYAQKGETKRVVLHRIARATPKQNVAALRMHT